MASNPDGREYSTVKDAEHDISSRLTEVTESDDWLPSYLPAGVIPTWTSALTGFEANCSVTEADELALSQIRATYRAVEDKFARTAMEIDAGTMATLNPSHVLFMVLCRDLQRAHADKANMNPHKLRVLLDGRYLVG
jgi:hypothetical protein